MKFLYIFLGFISLSLSASTVIYSSSYIDVVNLTQVKNSSIVINDNKITSIKKGFIQLSDEDVLIDLRGMTLMPGFMDMHVHFILIREFRFVSIVLVKFHRMWYVPFCEQLGFDP